MNNSVSLFTKLAQARKFIQALPVKKKGHNTYSGYDYFTPEQIAFMVDAACETVGLITQFEMVRDEYGIVGVLHLIDLKTGEEKNFKMATDIPAIKATNVAQQLGGAMTYTERYLKMTTFGITENGLDYDTTSNTKATVSEDKPKATPSKLKVMDKKTLEYFKDNLGKVPTAKMTNALKAYDVTSGYGAEAIKIVKDYAKNAVSK